jgi:hypothetical protein
MSEEKGFKSSEPDEPRAARSDEGEEVEGHVRSMSKDPVPSDEGDDPDVEGHFKANASPKSTSPKSV